MSDESKETFINVPLENSVVQPGKYRESETGETVMVADVSDTTVTFYYLSRGLKREFTLPLASFKRVGAYVPHE